MTLISDILLIAGALGVAFYCVVLSRRLTRFTDLENGVGGAIAVLSAQVDDMTRTLKAAQVQAGLSAQTLETLTNRADEVARRLELHVAALRDVEEAAKETPPPGPPTFLRVEAASESLVPMPEKLPVTGNPPVQSFFSSHRHG